ncbi:MAG: polyketide cyclase, partial [Pseudomonadota bacterium]
LTGALFLLGSANGAFANDKATVQVFYDFLSNPSSQSHAEAAKGAISADWESIGDYSGANKSREKFLAQIRGFGKLIPDLNWQV